MRQCGSVKIRSFCVLISFEPKGAVVANLSLRAKTIGAATSEIK
jgi:hypothetical protein